MDKEITNFTIIAMPNVKDLNVKVNKLIEEGWQPYGSITIDFVDVDITGSMTIGNSFNSYIKACKNYIQAMVKYKES